MGDDLADLGVTAAAIDRRHQRASRSAWATHGDAGIRSSRDSRRAGYRGRRSRRLRETCRPAAGMRCPRSAAGSWWRRARTRAGRACRARSWAELADVAQEGVDFGAGGRSRSRRVIGAVFAHRGTLAAFRHPIKWRCPACAQWPGVKRPNRRAGRGFRAALRKPRTIPRGRRRAACRARRSAA